MSDERDMILKCPSCKRSVVKVIPLYDDGEGRKICRECKREIKRTHPNKDFRHYKKEVGDDEHTQKDT